VRFTVDRLSLALSIVFSSLLGSAALGHAACGDPTAVATIRGQIAEQCSCSEAATHAAYVSCAQTIVRNAVADKTLPQGCSANVLRCVRTSTCGRPGAVTCCTTTSRGVTRCSVKSRASLCIAPSNGRACVGVLSSCCDACTASGCFVPPTPTPTPKPTPKPTPTPTPTQTPKPTPTPTPLPAICAGGIGLPPIGHAGFTFTKGTQDCDAPSTPAPGKVEDANGNDLGDLGAGCQYAGSLPSLKIPDGGSAIVSVVGLDLLTQTVKIAGSSGSPSQCTVGAGPGRHCSNGAPGSDGAGACTSDGDCKGLVGSCNLDANCYFGAPIPVPNGNFSACALNAFQTDICGQLNLLTREADFTAQLSARIYLTGNATSPCPQCLNGTCDSGQNAGQPCTGVGSQNTTLDCPPLTKQFFATLPLTLPSLTTGTSELTADSNGIFCPGQSSPGAFGLPNATRVSETGTPIAGSSSNLLGLTIGATFCIPPTGNGLIDSMGGFPTVGAVSVNGQFDLSSVLP
jgi:hypothetical protein